MLNDNLLGNKLTQSKNNINVPNTPSTESIPPESSVTRAVTGFVFIIRLFIFLFRAFVLGFAFKTLFNTDWSFWGYFAIGFSLNYIINSIAIFFNKQL